MEAAGLWKAAPRSRRAFPQPLENAARFPQLPQPLPLEKGGTKSKVKTLVRATWRGKVLPMSPVQSVTYVPGCTPEAG